jgi:hypothetical protein
MQEVLNPQSKEDFIRQVYEGIIMADATREYITYSHKQKEAERKSKEIIDAYSFLVSISPETHTQNQAEYTETTTASGIDDYQYKGVTLKVTFQNGSVYEYFGVPRNVYNKLNNSPTIDRFARRHIFHSHIYRKVMKSND